MLYKNYCVQSKRLWWSGWSFFFLRHFHSLPFPTWRGWFLIVGYMDDMEHQVFTPPGQSSHLPLTNWPAPNVWVFIAQMVEHCSPNAEAMSSNPVEVLNLFVCLFVFFWGGRVYLQLPKNCNYHCDNHILVQKFVFPQFTPSSCFIPFRG